MNHRNDNIEEHQNDQDSNFCSGSYSDLDYDAEFDDLLCLALCERRDNLKNCVKQTCAHDMIILGVLPRAKKDKMLCKK